MAMWVCVCLYATWRDISRYCAVSILLGIDVSPNATWYQDGPVTIRHTAASAGYGPTGQPFGAPFAVLVNGGTWVQRAALNITARTVGVSLEGASATWDQQAAVEIDVPANGVAGDSHTGISLGANQSMWNQRGTLAVSVGVGVGVRAGTSGMAQWNQTGDLAVAVGATLSTGPVDGIALGVGTLGEGAVWRQHGRAQMQVTATGIGAIGGGVALDANNNRHRWEQAGVLNVTALAQNGGLVRGVRIGQQSTTWTQTGPVLMDGTARTNGTVHGVVLGSAVWSANTWHQSGPLAIRIAACADDPLAPMVPSAAIRGTSRCGTWRSTDAVDLVVSSGLCSVTSAYPLWLDSHGCNFTLDRAAAIQDGPVRCDTAPAAPSPVAIRGLPLGTLVQGSPLSLSPLFFSCSPQRLVSHFFYLLVFPFIWTGACSDLALLPVVDLVWDGDGNGTVGWQKPAVVRARASGTFAGSLPFALSALPTVQANATQFAFPGTCAPATAPSSLCVSSYSPLCSHVAHTKVPHDTIHSCRRRRPFVRPGGRPSGRPHGHDRPPWFHRSRTCRRRSAGRAGGHPIRDFAVGALARSRLARIRRRRRHVGLDRCHRAQRFGCPFFFYIPPFVLSIFSFFCSHRLFSHSYFQTPPPPDARTDGNDTLVDGEAMSVRFGALTETRPDGGVLQVLRLGAGAGRWTSSETPITPDAAQEFVLTLAAETTTVEIIVALFDQRVQGLFDGVVPFVSDPALAKTSLRIAGWSWAAADSRIELDLALDPPFANFTRIDDAPTATTTYTLNGSTSGAGRATVRLSTAALVDGRLLAGAVSSHADTGAASIVISLPRFESALVYDPDMGVLFGSSSGGDDGDGNSGGGPGTPRAGKASDSSMDQTATVIAATASIGVAAVLVAAIIAGVVALQAYRQERLASTVAREVAFDPEVASDAVL